ncbi:MAG TPA: TetR/AcrR family transcriptional regulator [Pedomonas sp.]|uniref:TetR/AcrR family transcriptional regulator n=1 Tax=Pedomonas sp. TaxID=2976421 RepID=UPI002F3FA3CA
MEKEPEKADVSVSRRTRNKMRTREAILNAARECFGQGGVAGTTMDQIANEADVARATLFNYFPSKGDIVAVLVEELDEVFYRKIEALRKKPLTTAQRLDRLMRTTGKEMEESPPYIRTIVGASELGWNENVGAARFGRLIVEFQKMLEDGLATGEVRDDIDIRVLAEIVTSCLVGIVHNWRLDETYPLAKRMTEAGYFLAQTIVKPGQS